MISALPVAPLSDRVLVREAGWTGREVFAPELAGAAILTDDKSPLDRWNAPLAADLRRLNLAASRGHDD